MAKYSKDEVDYSRGKIHSHCGPSFLDDKGYCEHYFGPHAPGIGKCKLVAGEISPIMWCKEFERA